MDKLISVVIPVYNVEKYLTNCVESVLNQSYQNFEIILVDDGSTDNSGKICDSFSDPRIIVIHKNNGGLSDARNVGTSRANGDYITWLDSDDTLHKDFLKVLYSLACKSDADISAGRILCYEEGSRIMYPTGKFTVTSYQGIEALKKMLQGKLHGTSACGMLMKMNLARRYFFPYGKYHEDDFTTCHFYADAKTVVYTDQPLYFYLQRTDSIMHKPFGQADIDELDAADYIFNFCKKLGRGFESDALAKKFANYTQILFKYPDLKTIHKATYERIIAFIRKNRVSIGVNKSIHYKTKVKILLYEMRIYRVIENFRGKNR